MPRIPKLPLVLWEALACGLRNCEQEGSSRTVLAFNIGGLAKGIIGINRVAFWLVLIVGAVAFIAKLARR